MTYHIIYIWLHICITIYRMMCVYIYIYYVKSCMTNNMSCFFKSWDGMGTTFRQTSLKLGSMGSNCGTSQCIPFISMPSQIGNIGVYR